MYCSLGAVRSSNEHVTCDECEHDDQSLHWSAAVLIENASREGRSQVLHTLPQNILYGGTNIPGLLRLSRNGKSEINGLNTLPNSDSNSVFKPDGYIVLCRTWSHCTDSDSDPCSLFLHRQESESESGNVNDNRHSEEPHSNI